MTDFEEPGSLAPTGLYLGGTKYMVIQGEPGAVIRGKKVCVYIYIWVHIFYYLGLFDDCSCITCSRTCSM